jgi:hypothetical protein
MHASCGIDYLGQPGGCEMPPTHDRQDDAVIKDVACMHATRDHAGVSRAVAGAVIKHGRGKDTGNG